MGYQALLFCPDEKAARGVTQVLSELDFAVEPCTEPFAAVKKLMAQHFDAIVVDCDNEQNATLLFKSARNSSSNQSSLAVAVVEGQAGVAKAFRIGANLVLTKPINVEQAKGTLRVARGLLRKGGDPAKPAADPTVTPAGAAPVTAAVTIPKAPAASPRSDTTSAPSTAAATKTWPMPERKAAPAPALQPEERRTPPSAAVLTTDAAPKMDGSPKLDSAARPAVKPAPTSQPASPPKKYAWQASKSAAEPMSSALKKAAEAAGIADSQSHTSPSVSAPPPTAAASPATFGSAAAAAPAKAQAPAPVAPPLEEPPLEQPKATPAVRRETADHSFSAPELHPPTFSMGAPAVDEEEPGNSKKALIIVAIVLVLAAMAGYLFWKNASTKPSAPAPTSQTQTPTLPSAPASAGTPGSAGAPDAVTTASASKPATFAEPVMPTPAPKPSSKIAKDSTTPVTPAPAASQPTAAPAPASAAPALVVHNESAKAAPKVSQTDADAPAPSSLGLTSNADPHALAAIGSAPVAVPKVPTEVLKVSQGVSEGLVLKRVQPRYPTQALQMRKEGPVQLQATVGKDGSISNLKILSGDALLARAAQEAVKQWKYKPYYLNGEPVEIQTQITVNFKIPN